MFHLSKRWSTVLMGLLVRAACAQIPTPLTFPGMTAVGNGSAPITVTLTAIGGGNLTSLVALTGGEPNLDFAITSDTCVSIGTLFTTCVATVVFSPRYPGVRRGAVVAESNGQLLASAPLSGVGQGSLPVLVPGTINTVAGETNWIYQGDGVPATQAPIFLPSGLAADAAGNLFLCDTSNNRVRMVTASTGLISTVAGNGSPGSSGDGGQATAAELNNPSGLVIDGAGNLLIADTGNNVVRRVDAVSHVITTFAGQIGSAGYTGDGGLGTIARLSSPRGLALMPGGDLLITDSANNAIRLVNITTNLIQTVAGTGTAGSLGDGGLATLAQLNDPFGVAVSSAGAIAVADLGNERVRLFNLGGTISTAVVPAEQLNGPASAAFDAAGDLFIADTGNNRVLAIFDGITQTVAGNGSEQFTGDGGPANLAGIYGPYSLLFDAAGNLWLSDTFHNRIREISGSFLGFTYATIKVSNVSPPQIGALYNQGNANLVLSTPVLNQAALSPATTCNPATIMVPAAFCTMEVEFAPTEVGAAITGSIQWPSNAPNVTPVDGLSGQVLSVNVTSISLASSANPGVVGKPITLTATVSNSDHGGTVTFSEGGTTWCSAVAVTAGGTSACIISGLSLGSHTFTAVYSGDANNAASTSPPYTEPIKQQPALVLGVSPNPATVNSTVTLTLTAVDQTGTVTGSIVFYDGATALATVALNGSGIAQWSTQTFTVRTHTLTAQYAGDSANVSATSNAVSEQITQAGTATALATSAANSPVGVPVTFTATVTNNNGPSPTGSIVFKDGTSVLGTGALSNGTSGLVVSTLAPGSHNITATYSGDTDDAASTSATTTEQILQIATVTTLGADANPLNIGATLHLTANVSLAPGALADGALTGNVTFWDGTTALGTVAISAGGQAALATSTLSVGSHSLTAGYAGITNYSASNSPAVPETVQQTATQTTLSAASSSLAGKSATFNVMVTSATGIPAGLVTFRDGSTVLGTATLSGTGGASFSTSTLTPGTHSITASYSGNSSYIGSTSAAAQYVVQLAQPTLTLNGPANPVDAGTTANFVVALTSPGVPPTGSLLLLDSGATLATVAVTADGSFPFSSSALSIGTHTLTASYSGDANNSSAASASVTVIVRQASSSTSLVSSANPLTQGNALTLNATVTSASPNAGGTVDFYDGATLLDASPLGTNGTATYSPAGLTLGTHSLTAVYVGDTNHAGSTSSPVTEVVIGSTSATLTSNDNPAASGQSVTFTAKINGAGKTVPTGTATFRDNGTLLTVSALDSLGVANASTSALTVGSHTITMSYAGDQNFAGTAAQLTQTIADATTQIALTASTILATFGKPVTFTATVTSNGGEATGSVNFVDAGVTIGTGQLSASGVALLAVSTLSPGSHTIVATYAGDGKAAPSTSTPLMLSVRQTTALALSSSSNPGLTLSPISFTATLTHTGASAASGMIAFTDAGTAIGTASLDATGHAALSLPAMSAASHAIVATYAGDGSDFSSTSAPYNETVQLRPTSTTMTTVATSSQEITLIGVVNGQGSVAPSGTVTFTSGGVTLGQATIGATGVGTVTVLISQPTQPVTASYSGDVNYAASQSSAAAIAAPVPAPFTLVASPPSLTLVTHQHTTLSVNVVSVQGFTDTIALGCVGLPSAGTCTFNPSQVLLSANGTASASVVVDTGNPLGAGSSTSASVHPSSRIFLCWLPLGLLAGFLWRKEGRAFRGRLGMVIVFAVAMAVTLGVVGCSGLSTKGTPPGSYTFKIVGTGKTSGASETQTITLVVTE